MAAGDKVVKTVLKYEVQGQQAVTQSLATVRKQADADFQRQIANANLLADARLKGDAAFTRQLVIANRVADAQEKLVTTANAELSVQQRITAEADKQLQSANARKSVIRDIGIQATPDPSFGAFGNENAANRNLTRRIGGLREAAIALPGVGYQSPLVVGIRAVGLIADKTGASLLQLGAAGAAVGAAAIVAGIALDRFTKGIQDAKNALTGALSGQSRYTEALSKFTNAQAAEEAENEGKRLANLRTQRAAVQAALDSAFAQAQAQFGDAGARALDAAGQLPTAQLRDQLKDLDSQIASTDGFISLLIQGLEAGAFAANTAAEAAHKLAEAQLADLEQQIGINGMTKAQREERLRVLGSENSIMNALVISGQLNTEALIAVAKAQEKNREEAEALAGTTGTLADILKAEADAKQLLIDKSDAVNEVTRDLAEAQTDAAEAAAKVAEVLLKYEEAAARFNEKVAEIAANLLEAEAKANARAEEDRIEAEAKANEQREDLREKHLKKLEQIESKANAMIANAIASRDALALYLAQQNKAQQIKDEKADFEERKKAIDKSLKEQNAVIDKRLKEQLQTAKEAADKALAQERKRRDEEIRTIQAAHQKALEEERRFNAALEVQQALSLFSRQYWNNAVIAGQQAVDNATALYVQNLANYANGISITAALIGGLTGGTTGTGGGYGLPPPITPGVFGAPSPTSYTQNNAAHFTFSPTINATTERQIAQAVDRRVHQMFQQARGQR